jgi:hypothetical protein
MSGAAASALLHSAQLERCVLDCCISNPARIPEIRSLITPHAFYTTSHRAVYTACLELADAGVTPDLVTVTARLDQTSQPDNGLTWHAIVADLVGAAPLYLNATTYALDVADLHRRRRLAQAARQLADDADNPDHLDRLRRLLAEPPAQTQAAPFALEVDVFIADRSPLPAALIGNDEDVLLPTAGLMLEFAKGGRGKTTLTIELAFHAASAIEWLGFPIQRPLRVLFIENEGPRESFRAKLERKRRTWPHQLRGALFIQSMAWGALSLAQPTHLDQLRRFIEAERIDLVIGDPLDSLGLAGVGSPENTRDFMGLLARVGLFTDVAFVLLAHPRKELTSDELDEIAGAWGGRPDTMLRLARQPANRARLSFPKFRWSRRSEHPALILSFDAQTDTFAVVAREHENVIERDLVAELRSVLERSPWRTVAELAARNEEGGIGVRKNIVKQLLEDPAGPFTSSPGKLVGRHPSATCWNITSEGGPGLGTTGTTS